MEPTQAPAADPGRFDGGCLCGAVRYRAGAAPVLRFNCHCRDCQRTTGSGFAPFAVFDEAALAIAGDCRFHAGTGGSGGRVERGFCPGCGASLFVRAQLVPGRLFVLAGTLDDPSSFAPRAHIHARHAPPWSRPDPALPAFPGAAPAKPQAT